MWLLTWHESESDIVGNYAESSIHYRTGCIDVPCQAMQIRRYACKIYANRMLLTDGDSTYCAPSCRMEPNVYAVKLQLTTAVKCHWRRIALEEYQNGEDDLRGIVGKIYAIVHPDRCGDGEDPEDLVAAWICH